MFPGMTNPAQLNKMLKQFGIKTENIEAQQIIFKTKENNLIINNPQITKMTVQGQDMFQIVGKLEEIETEDKFEKTDDESIKLVMQQTNCTKEEATEMLNKTNGDIADAIMRLKP